MLERTRAVKTSTAELMTSVSSAVAYWLRTCAGAHKGIILLISRPPRIQASGILERWPKLINRNNLNIGSDNFRPIGPKMTSDVQKVFSFLGCGMVISIVFIAFELSGLLLKFIKRQLNFFIKKVFKDILDLSSKPQRTFDGSIICINVQCYVPQ